MWALSSFKNPRGSMSKTSSGELTSNSVLGSSATQVFNDSPTLLRSYGNPTPFRGITDAKIWEAGRATPAASAFFDPITIGHHGEKFADGGLALQQSRRACASRILGTPAK